jgi:protein TonB
MIRSLALFAVLCLSLGSFRAAAAPKWTCYFQSTLTDNAYQSVAVARIHKHWRAPKAHPAQGKKAVIRTVLGKDGAIRSNDLHLSSGSKAWDESVLSAISAAGPFPPLPKSYAYETVELDCHVAP